MVQQPSVDMFQLGDPVDSLALLDPSLVPGASDVLVAGSSRVVGPYWTGGVTLLRADVAKQPSAGTAGAAAEVKLQRVVRAETNAGVAAVAVVPGGAGSLGGLEGQCIVSGSDDGLVALWSAAGGSATSLQQAEGQVSPSDRAVTCVAPAPDSTTLASSYEDGTVKLWDMAGGTLSMLWSAEAPSAARVAQVAWGGASPQVLAAAAKGGCSLLETKSGRAAAHAPCGQPLTCISWHGDSYLLVGDLLGRVSLYDIRAGLHNPLARVAVHTESVNQLTVLAPAEPAAGAMQFVSCGDDGAVRVTSLDASKGADAAATQLQVSHPHAPGAYLRSAAVSELSGVVYSAGSDGCVAATRLVALT